MAAKHKCLAQMNKSGTAGKTTKKERNHARRVVPMVADDLVREALIFAQCSTAVVKIRQAIKSTRVRFVPQSGACRSPIQALIRCGVLTASLR